MTRQAFAEDIVLNDGSKVHVTGHLAARYRVDPASVRDFLEIQRLRRAVRKLRGLVNDAVAWDAACSASPLERIDWIIKAKEAMAATEKLG